MLNDLIKLKQNLETRFNLKLFCDIADISSSPNALIKMLSAVQQTSYEPTDRIVFYTSHPLPETLLKHLYETCNFLDISNWFVLICSSTDSQASLTSCVRQYSQDPVPFQFLSADLSCTKTIQNNFVLPDTICAIPWQNLEIKHNGDITPCCMSSATLGNIIDTSLDQAFHGKAMQQLRQNFLLGERPDVCKHCWKVEEKNLTSIRKHNINRLKKNFLVKYLDRPQLANLDLKFNNTCNFKCRICGPTSSSLFAAEEHKFRGTALVLQEKWGEEQNFIDQVVEHLPDIKNIDMYGGEPFLIKKFQQVLQLAVEKNLSGDIRLHYNSNGSIWPDNLISLWPSFRQVDIHFSIDAIGKQFELQRGGSWHEVENNILRLKNLNIPNINISIMPTIGSMNLFYIDQVYDWAVKNQFPIFVSHARGEGFDLSSLTADAKKIIIEKYADHPWAELQNIVKIVKELPDSDGSAFRKKIQWFDQIRKENFAADHTEVAKAMGYVNLT